MAEALASDWNTHWGQVVAKSWQDEAFKKRLLANPAAVMKEVGMAVPPGVTIKVMENTSTVCYLTLPAKPDKLSEADLERVAGGYREDPCAGGRVR